MNKRDKMKNLNFAVIKEIDSNINAFCEYFTAENKSMFWILHKV